MARFTCVFQFTLPRGERLDETFALFVADIVSIHAPAGGATGWALVDTDGDMFQFTLPRGERPEKTLRAVISLPCFNSRSRGGSDDDLVLRAFAPALVSIHAPAGGATPGRGDGLDVVRRVSIHAPAGGATGHGSTWSARLRSFQFTLPRGERLIRADSQRLGLRVSIHAPAGGATSCSGRCA